jgi:hypothetical protein
MFYMIIVFMAAGMVGVAARRDEQPGIGEMLDAAPAPCHVRLVGRAAAAVTITALLAVLPGVSGILVTAMVAPESLRLLQPIVLLLTVLTPALLEISAFTLLLHALIRRKGPAYAASMLVAFIAVVNFETDLVSYPPLQIGRPVRIGLSGLTGLTPWLEKIALGDGFKLALVLLLLALAALLVRRGTDSGWRARWWTVRRRLSAGSVAVVLAACLALAYFSGRLHQRFVVEGGYEPLERQLASDAAWETRWAREQGAFSTTGGRVELEVDSVHRQLHGHWRLRGVRSATGVLHAELPFGLQVTGSRVQGREVVPVIEEDHLALPLDGCAEAGCEVELSWSLAATGWAEGERPSWLQRDGCWLHAPEVMPRLGFDADRVLRTPYDRQRFGLPEQIHLPGWESSLPSGAAAPAGRWTWRVTVDDGGSRQHIREDELEGLLDFAAVWGPSMAQTEIAGVTLRHDRSRVATAAAVAEDLADMQAGVARWLGVHPDIHGVAQWPRELGDSTVSGQWLLLAEDPHWDVAEQGVGRWVRRAEIAEALARRVVRDACDLREGEGAVWLNDGLPGAIGLLCVAETDGLEALAALLSRGADQVTQTLAASSVPVGPLKDALTDGWAADYAPLAAFNWVSGQTPQRLAMLLEQVRSSGDVAAALTTVAGADVAEVMLGLPNASDMHVAGAASRPQMSGERWQWRGGGWTAIPSVFEARRYRLEDGRLVARQDGDKAPISSPEATDVLYLDAWPSYEREADDNLLHSAL